MNAQQQVENELINQDTWLLKMINVVRYTFTRTFVKVMDRKRFLSYELNAQVLGSNTRYYMHIVTLDKSFT